MKLRFLKTFCDVVDMGSLSEAARCNGISQSAVSQQLAGLEQDAGVQLLSRGGGFVAPTEAGGIFYRAANDILQRYEAMLGDIRAARDTVSGRLRLGTITSVGFYLLDPVIREFMKAHPEVDLHVSYERWNRIQSAVGNGEMDLGVLVDPGSSRGVRRISLAREELVFVCYPGHPLAGTDTVEPEALDGERFIAFEDDVPTRRVIDKLLRDHGVHVEIIMSFGNNETIKRAVETEAGVSILPRDNIENETAAGRLTFARFDRPDEWVRQVTILRPRGRAATAAGQAFLELLRSRLKRA